ncbi:MAG TPA: sugar transferase [Bryobacteraceae bacterium]|jgi:exopolysaccharide production protein ExoY|nr:sugar transferase [Bryobacteraceae bacterium]
MAELVGVRTNSALASVSADRPLGLSRKRVLDIILAGSAIVLLAPLLTLCFLACLFTSPGPAIFRHRRVGFGGKRFACLKFRTMLHDSQDCLRDYLASNPEANKEWEATHKLQFDPRVTAIGAILRKTSLDELPQLFNVLMGDMSIVGPRPVTEEELSKYSNSAGAYLSCRPGITGLWQVSGRSGTTYSKRVACDSYYAANWSMTLDLKILLVTLPVLLNADNAY